MGSPLQLVGSPSVCVTVGLVAGSTNGVPSTGVIVDTQPYATSSSEGNLSVWLEGDGGGWWNCGYRTPYVSRKIPLRHPCLIPLRPVKCGRY